ncbi:uracil-xanthine permease family protein [uncultured Acetobacteroides sp.]|uniref:uracil-xanthine permease family protein n=1 Tax=uncultured Acetobacteroides sp. TaxID=1760811 RepID=UPI0029F45CD5|nr:uracil-xanthine permease family protein [uncultured Acetobacteroides sp.]
MIDKHSEYDLTPQRRIVIGVQFLFVAFGATVLVPLLVGLDPSVALFTAGLGTLIFQLITKGKVPIFLGSSFAFIAPIQKATALYGLAGTLSGMAAVGVIYGIVSALIKWRGIGLVKRLFPSAVYGPVIILIGVSLAPTGVKMASSNWPIACISLAGAIVALMYGRGILKLIPVFIGIVVGYVVSIFTGNVDFSVIANAPWISMPKFVTPEFSIEAVLYLIPVALAPIVEHVGDIYAISAVTGKDFVKDPGLHRTMLGDGVACAVAGFVGGPPATTYAEVTGAIALTKVFDPRVLQISGVTAIAFAFLGKINGFLKSIPEAVLGGIMLILFGIIATIGIKTMIVDKLNLSKSRNQIIVALILTVGIGGVAMKIGEFELSGIGLAAIVGIVLNLILPDRDK